MSKKLLIHVVIYSYLSSMQYSEAPITYSKPLIYGKEFITQGSRRLEDGNLGEAREYFLLACKDPDTYYLGMLGLGTVEFRCNRKYYARRFLEEGIKILKDENIKPENRESANEIASQANGMLDICK